MFNVLNIIYVAGVGPLLPAGPRGVAGTLGVSPACNHPPQGSGGSGVQAPQVRPRLGLPPEHPSGESNIHGTPMLLHGPFVPRGTQRAPLALPQLGIPTNPGVPPASAPPVQLIGNGSPRSTFPLLDPTAAAIRPVLPQVSDSYITV